MQDIALIAAGIIGSGTAIIHGVITQRVMTQPFSEHAWEASRFSTPIRRIMVMLLHYSTFAWLASGLALVAAALWADESGVWPIALLVGSQYAYAAIGNFWGTRGRHPGWMLMAAAVGLIAFGLAT